MSLKAILWVMESAPVDDPTDLCILYALADRADDDGCGAYPAREWIAERARVSLSTVARRLQKLKDAGVISLGDQSLVSHYRADRRPVVYDLDLRGVNLPRGVKTEGTACQKNPYDVSNQGLRGVTADTQTVLNHPKPSKTSDTEEFDRFWAVYPRKIAKGQARKAFATALKKTDAGKIIAGAEKYRDMPGRTERYTKHASSWLNSECWDDEYEPAVKVIAGGRWEGE